MSPEQIHEICRNGLIAYAVMAAAGSIIWSAFELRKWLVCRNAYKLNRMKMEHDYALYTQQLMLEQTRLIVDLERTRKGQ